MDGLKQPQQQYSDEASLEASETVITEKPVQIVSSIEPPQENRTFVGYQPPKPGKLQKFVKNHAVKLIVGAFAVVVLSISGTIYLASSHKKEISLAAPAQNANQVAVPKTELKDEQKDIKPAEIQASYSLKPGDKMFKLVSDGEIWLERSESEWMNYVTADNWLYFTVNRPQVGDESSVVAKLGLVAFNFKSKQYISLGDVDKPSGLTLEMPMVVRAGYLYVPLTQNKTGGKSYRCKLDVDKACGSIDLFYDQSGALHILGDQEAISVDTATSGELYTYSLKKFTFSSKQLAEFRSGSMTKGIGEYVAAFSDDGLTWIVKSDVSRSGAEDAQAVVEQLTAVDSSGAQKFMITQDSLPLIDASLAFSDVSKPYEILFTNAQKQVVFDVNKKEFGATAKKTAAAPSETASDFLDRAEESLHLPSLFSIKEIL